MSAPVADERTARLAVLGVTTASFGTPMMLTGVNVAVPHIGAELALDAVLVSWIPLAYLLAASVSLLPAGRGADLLGRRRMFLAGIACASAGSIGAALAPGFVTLLLMRALQGVGAGMIFANTAAILSSAVAPARRGRAIGRAASAVYFGLCVGPMLAGACIELFGWRAALLFHLPFHLAALLIMARVGTDWRAEQASRFDMAGATLFALAMLCLIVGVSLLPAGSAWWLLGVAGIAFAGFLREQAARSAPLIDVGLLRHNRVFSFSCMASLLSYAATFGITFLLSIYLQDLRGLSAPLAGLLLAAQPAMMAVLSPLAGRASDSIEPRLLSSLGMLGIAVGLAGLAALGPDTGYAWLVVSLMVVGTGFAMFSAPNINAIMGSVDRGRYGIASAISATTRTVGQLFAMGLVTMVFALELGDVAIARADPAAVLAGLRLCFIVAAGACLLGLLFSAARGTVHARPAG